MNDRSSRYRPMTVEEKPLLEKEDTVPPWFRCFVKPCAAEFFMMTIFVFVGCMSTNSGILVNTALTHGFTIAILISAFGPISGGHINPAVTLGAVLAGKTSPLLAVAYFFCQIGGCLFGAGLVKGALPSAIYNQIGGGAQDIGASVTVGQAILCEIVATTFLVLVIMMTALDTDKNKLAPIIIGITLAAAIFAVGPISGGSLNPARSFGPAVAVTSHTDTYWTHHYVYWVGPLIGSLLAGFLYRFMFANDEKRLVFTTL